MDWNDICMAVDTNRYIKTSPIGCCDQDTIPRIANLVNKSCQSKASTGSKDDLSRFNLCRWIEMLIK